MTVELPFHHQTTVVAGLDRLEAEALALEILASVENGRPGLSADISTQTGRRLEIKRPLGDPNRVLDVDTASDVTADMMVNGFVHPLTALGISSSLRVTKADLVAAEQSNDRVVQLSRLDQDHLWGLAITLAELEVEIARQTDDAVVADQICPDATGDIERARTDVELANQRLEQLSDQSIVAAASLVLIAFAVAFITHPFVAAPFLIAAIAVAWRSWNWHKEHEEAIAAEQEVLQSYGLESYLDFQLRKVDALTNDTKHRRSALALAEKRRFALSEWRALVGSDISLEWAAAHRPTIATAAQQMANAASDADAAAASEAVPLALANRIRQATDQAEPSPLIVDDIFSAQADATVERLLWLVDHHCQQLQFILLSSDERVLRWAAQRAVARQATILRLTEDTSSEPLALSDDHGEHADATETESTASILADRSHG